VAKKMSAAKRARIRGQNRLRRSLGWNGRKIPAIGTVVQAALGSQRAGIIVAHGPHVEEFNLQDVWVKWLDAPEVSQVRLANLTAHVDAVVRLAVLGMIA